MKAIFISIIVKNNRTNCYILQFIYISSNANIAFPFIQKTKKLNIVFGDIPYFIMLFVSQFCIYLNLAII